MQQREKIWGEKCIKYAQEHDNIFPDVKNFKSLGGDISYVRKKYGGLFKFYDYIDPKHQYKRKKVSKKSIIAFERNKAIHVQYQIYYLVNYKTHEVIDKGFAKDLEARHSFQYRTLDHLTKAYKKDYFILTKKAYAVAKACDFNKPEYNKIMLFAYGKNCYRGKQFRKEMDQEREYLLTGIYSLSDFLDMGKYEGLFNEYPPFQKEKQVVVKVSELRK